MSHIDYINDKQSPITTFSDDFPTSPKVCRVAVLTSSYEGSDSVLVAYEGQVPMNPGYFFSSEDKTYRFTLCPLRKATVYRDLRALIKSGKYDVYFNLCDGAKDEDRAGEEVVRVLEEFNVPFTGSRSKYYEISKPDMKMIAHYSKIRTARYAVVESSEDPAEKCAHLTFPVIVKHISGYSSIGMTKDSKCLNMDELIPRCLQFMSEFQYALVEEFIIGDEVTILACEDSSQPSGVRVFQPVMVRFPEGEDFKHFHLKWAAFEGMEWLCVPDDDPALPQMIDIGRKAFKEMMGGIGYGRCDLRVNRERNEVVFLEINPNCGIMYPPGQEGSADWILRFSPTFGHREFAKLQIRSAATRFHDQRPMAKRCFDAKHHFHLRSIRSIDKGTVIFNDEGREVRLYTKPFIEKNWSKEEQEAFSSSCWPLGKDKHFYAVWDIEPSKWRNFNHSCQPNMKFAANRSLNVVAARDILIGEELTMDYRTFSDDNMHEFSCYCGSPNCAGIICPKQIKDSPTK